LRSIARTKIVADNKDTKLFVRVARSGEKKKILSLSAHSLANNLIIIIHAIYLRSITDDFLKWLIANRVDFLYFLKEK